jgi:hypothetical protein
MDGMSDLEMTNIAVGQQAVDHSVEAKDMHVLPNEQLLEVDLRQSLAGQCVKYLLAIQIVVSAMQRILIIHKFCRFMLHEPLRVIKGCVHQSAQLAQLDPVVRGPGLAATRRYFRLFQQHSGILGCRRYPRKFAQWQTGGDHASVDNFRLFLLGLLRFLIQVDALFVAL